MIRHRSWRRTPLLRRCAGCPVACLTPLSLLNTRMFCGSVPLYLCLRFGLRTEDALKFCFYLLSTLLFKHRLCKIMWKDLRTIYQKLTYTWLTNFTWMETRVARSFDFPQIRPFCYWKVATWIKWCNGCYTCCNSGLNKFTYLINSCSSFNITWNMNWSFGCHKWILFAIYPLKVIILI